MILGEVEAESTHDVTNRLFKKLKELKLLRDSIRVKDIDTASGDQTRKVVHIADTLPRPLHPGREDILRDTHRVIGLRDGYSLSRAVPLWPAMRLWGPRLPLWIPYQHVLHPCAHSRRGLGGMANAGEPHP